MRKEIREVDKKNGIVQITTYDERWYARPKSNRKTKLPEYEFVPSITWIASHYPKGIGFYKWLGTKGWDEAEAIKIAAGDKGSKVHKAISELIDGNEVRMNSKILNPTTEQEEELTVEEYEAIMSFKNWFQEVKPDVLDREKVYFNDHQGIAGTIDLLCRIKDEVWLIDFKTGQTIWPEHTIQLTGYKYMIENDIEHDIGKVKTAVLQLGYRRDKDGFKFTEIQTKWELFLAAKEIWANETAGQQPSQKDYPVTLTLEEKKEVSKKK